MKVMVFFVLACFLVGLLMVGQRSVRRVRVLLGLCLFVGFAYYFLHQI